MPSGYRDGVFWWKPDTAEEVYRLLRSLGVDEGYDFLGYCVEEGWAADRAAAKAWLDDLGVEPIDD